MQTPPNGLKVIIPFDQEKGGSDINNISLWNQSHQDIAYGEAKQGGKQWQEDCFLTMSSPHNRVTVSAVFDGHGGYNGMIASTTARKSIYNFFFQNRDVIESWEPQMWSQQLKILFDRLHYAIRNTFLTGEFNDGETALSEGGKHFRYIDEKGVIRMANGDPIHGGTTASVCILLLLPDGKRYAICANAGDSDTILCANDGTWERISEDHTPDSISEWKRVHDLDENEYPIKLIFIYDKISMFKKSSCPLIFLPDGTKDPAYVTNPWGNGLHPTNVRYEPAVYAVTPAKVNNKDTTCIAMTRSLGLCSDNSDFYAHQFGMSHVPSVKIKELQPNLEYVIAVASDGIWDCWKFGEFASQVVELVTPTCSLPIVVNSMLSDTISKAIQNFGMRHYDDASLIFIRVPSSSKCIGGNLSFDTKPSINIAIKSPTSPISSDSSQAFTPTHTLSSSKSV